MVRQWGMYPAQAEGAREATRLLREAHDRGDLFRCCYATSTCLAQTVFALLRDLREEGLIEGTRVVLVTSNGQRGDAARSRELGIAGYLTKPLRQSDLQAAILDRSGRELLGEFSERRRSPGIRSARTGRGSARRWRKTTWSIKRWRGG